MTARQRLVQELTSRLLLHNVKAMLGREGYHRIAPKMPAMVDLVEGTAREMGGRVWEYYLEMSDCAYYRLEREAYERS